MIKVGQEVRVTKNKTGRDKDPYKISTKNRQAKIYALTENVITVEYIKDDKPTTREAFNLADIIENIVSIEVKTKGESKKVDKSYFKG